MQRRARRSMLEIDLIAAEHPDGRIAGSECHSIAAQSTDVQADACRSRNARLPRDEAAPLEHLHHLVDARRADEEVPLDVGLGGCSAKALNVLGDESEVFGLASGRALGVVP